MRDRQREEKRDALQVVRESELPLEVSRQGLMRWYLHPGKSARTSSRNPLRTCSA